jgi:hypothetical protein
MANYFKRIKSFYIKEHSKIMSFMVKVNSIIKILVKLNMMEILLMEKDVGKVFC